LAEAALAQDLSFVDLFGADPGIIMARRMRCVVFGVLAWSCSGSVSDIVSDSVSEPGARPSPLELYVPNMAVPKEQQTPKTQTMPNVPQAPVQPSVPQAPQMPQIQTMTDAQEAPGVGMVPLAMMPGAEVDQALPGGAYMLAQPIAEEPASPFAFFGGFAGGLAAGAALVYSLVKSTGQKMSTEAAKLELGALRSIDVENPPASPYRAGGLTSPALLTKAVTLPRAAVSMKAEGEIGVTPPLGVWDPLGCLDEPVKYPRRDYRRYQELEIKHGRIAMLATVGVITTEAGFRWPGYLSKSMDLKFSDIPGGALESWAAVPTIGWLQIIAFVIFLELGYCKQDPDKEPGDIGGVTWIRYDDPEVKKFKLNVERNNGRAAMMGIIGMMTHNALGVDSLFPIVQ